jgi:hypothetical protein
MNSRFLVLRRVGLKPVHTSAQAQKKPVLDGLVGVQKTLCSFTLV